MRPRVLVSEDSSPDTRWDTLASLWFSEPGIDLDLHTAASIGDVEGVKRWAMRGADMAGCNTGGWTPLMYAAYLGHEDVCQLLLQVFSSIDRSLIDARSIPRRQTALMLAASCGNENTVGLLLKNGASVDAVDERHRSALHYATDCNHAHIARQLLSAGANPHLPPPPDIQQQGPYSSPFELACGDGLDLIVHLFLQRGAAEMSHLVESGRALAVDNGHGKIVSMIDNYRQSGENGLKFDDKFHSSKYRYGLLEGPNAISTLMKLQCRLNTPNDSHQLNENQKHAHGQQRAVDEDYDKTLTVEQQPRPTTIEELLDVLQLSKYLEIFRERNVDLQQLLAMNSEDLKEIGIKLFGPRKKLLNAIERWNQNVPLTGVL